MREFTASVPPTFKFCPIPTPPETTRAPVTDEVDVAVSITYTCVAVEKYTSPTPSGSIIKLAPDPAGVVVSELTAIVPPTVRF